MAFKGDYSEWIPVLTEVDYPNKFQEFMLQLSDDVTEHEAELGLRLESSTLLINNALIKGADSISRDTENTGITVDGSDNMSGVRDLTITGDIESIGDGTIKNINFNALNTETVELNLGKGRSGNGYCTIDLRGSNLDNGFGFRFLRGNSGPDTKSVLQHRGTGDFQFLCTEEGAMEFMVGDANPWFSEMHIDKDGVNIKGLFSLAGTEIVASADDINACENFDGVISCDGTNLTMATDKIFRPDVIHCFSHDETTSNLYFNNSFSQTKTISANTIFTTTGKVASITKRIELVLTASGGPYDLNFPPTWRWLGVMPTEIAEDNKAILSLRCDGVSDADVIAVYAEEV